MSTNKYKATLRLEEDLYARVQLIAEHENRSLNNLLEYWIMREEKLYAENHRELFNSNSSKGQ